MWRRHVRPRGAAGHEPISRAPAGWSASALREELDGMRNSEVQPRDCRGRCHLWSSPSEEQPGMGRLRIVEIRGNLRGSSHEVSKVTRDTGVTMRPHPTVKHASPDLAARPSAESHDSGSSNSHFLHAGQVFVSAEGKSIVLILGSCVGVCMWDAVNSIGGATPLFVPSWGGGGGASAPFGHRNISICGDGLLQTGA